jgi:hypothetical protein
MTQENTKWDRFIRWLIYWFVPIDADAEETQHRLFEIGLSIGTITTSVGIILYLVFGKGH